MCAQHQQEGGYGGCSIFAQTSVPDLCKILMQPPQHFWGGLRKGQSCWSRYFLFGSVAAKCLLSLFL